MAKNISFHCFLGLWVLLLFFSFRSFFLAVRLLLEELLVGLDFHDGADLLLQVLEEDEEDGNGEEDNKSEK